MLRGIVGAVIVAGSLLASLAHRRALSSSATSLAVPYKHYPHLQEGWSEAVHKWRLKLVEIAVKEDDNNKDHLGKSFLVDISPFQQIISEGIDTFGIRSMLGEVFHDIEWYFPTSWYRPKSKKKEEACNWHGIGCDYYDLWFIWHYVGVVMAEKLLNEGSLLLDGSTGERLDSAVQVMDEIHRLQTQPFVTRMSFHAEHGFIWHYLVATMPDLDSYPNELAQAFCGKYNEKHYVPSVKKQIGGECYHGFGHAMWEILAVQQLRDMNDNAMSLSKGIQYNYTTSTAFRAKSGFVLTDASFCKGFKLCEQASEYPEAARKHCHGGMTHAAWLYSPGGALTDKKKKVDGIFKKARDRCEHSSA